MPDGGSANVATAYYANAVGRERVKEIQDSVIGLLLVAGIAAAVYACKSAVSRSTAPVNRICATFRKRCRNA